VLSAITTQNMIWFALGILPARTRKTSAEAVKGHPRLQQGTLSRPRPLPGQCKLYCLMVTMSCGILWFSMGP